MARILGYRLYSELVSTFIIIMVRFNQFSKKQLSIDVNMNSASLQVNLEFR